ncbi:hypothetical protein N657DRAFT_568213 [Parathielavia appendiculata]|uniref:Uncharacterized protein n=1 Tax=Parathielavia appendiculata TaxID=2587402 RepID=A0AAN6U5C3_9PEZI|nr:hypothetical protein N657DRAFT_568213 [Parathielavia appendiculata]
MANGLPRGISGLPSPDPAASEGNSSVQVNLDSASNHGEGIGRRSRSPSMRRSSSRGQSLARQATANSLSSFLSSQPSSQPSQTERAPPEDLLRDLIDATESSSVAISGCLHGVKRPHDDETADEPLAKRDKLGEELERMSAAHLAAVSTLVAPASSAFPAAAARPYAPPANGSPLPDHGDPTVGMGTRGRLPIRPSGRRPQHPSNGTHLSRNSIPEGHEQASHCDDESERSSDGPGIGDDA